MNDPIILYQVAKLHQDDVKRKLALVQVANQAQSANPVSKQRFDIMSMNFLKKLAPWRKQETVSTDKHLFSNTNA
jgi:hypothetical protein